MTGDIQVAEVKTVAKRKAKAKAKAFKSDEASEVQLNAGQFQSKGRAAAEHNCWPKGASARSACLRQTIAEIVEDDGNLTGDIQVA